MNATAAHLTVVPDIDSGDPLVDLIAAHVEAATGPHLVRSPAESLVSRQAKQARFNAEGLPRGLHCIERV